MSKCLIKCQKRAENSKPEELPFQFVYLKKKRLHSWPAPSHLHLPLHHQNIVALNP